MASTSDPAADTALAALQELFPEEDWHEDEGAVLWHHLDEWGVLCEDPIVSTGGDCLAGRQPWDGYYSHWSRLPPMPRFPIRALMIAPPRTLICDEEPLA